jgi:hypothetical protein
VTVRCALPPAFTVPALHRLGDNPYEFGKRTNRLHGRSIAQMFILSQLPGHPPPETGELSAWIETGRNQGASSCLPLATVELASRGAHGHHDCDSRGVSSPFSLRRQAETRRGAPGGEPTQRTFQVRLKLTASRRGRQTGDRIAPHEKLGFPLASGACLQKKAAESVELFGSHRQHFEGQVDTQDGVPATAHNRCIQPAGIQLAIGQEDYAPVSVGPESRAGSVSFPGVDARSLSRAPGSPSRLQEWCTLEPVH